MHKQPKPIVEGDTAKVVYRLRLLTFIRSVVGEPHSLCGPCRSGPLTDFGAYRCPSGDAMPFRLRFLQQFLLTASLSLVACLGTGYSTQGETTFVRKLEIVRTDV